MVKIEPPAGRAIVTEGLRGLEITIPAKRKLFVTVFLAFWLVGWAFGEVMALIVLFGQGGDVPPQIFLLAWLGMWTVGGMVSIYVWLWSVAGKEIVSVDETTLAIKRDVLGIGRTREFDMEHVVDLRVTQGSSDWWGARGGFGAVPMTGGTIAFDYGAKTYRFGISLDEAEAGQLVRQIQERYKIPGDSEGL